MESRPRTNLVLGPAILAAKFYNYKLFFSFNGPSYLGVGLVLPEFYRRFVAAAAAAAARIKLRTYAHGSDTTKKKVPAAQMTTKP